MMKKQTKKNTNTKEKSRKKTTLKKTITSRKTLKQLNDELEKYSKDNSYI